jgi:lipopolysaccharide export system permease protein
MQKFYIPKLIRYIAITVFSSIVLVTLVLAALYVIFTFIAQASNVGQAGYGASDALAYVFLTLPANMVLFLPISGFLGSLMGLGLLAQNSELIAMRASGVTIKTICKGVALCALVFVALSYVLGAYLGPVLQYHAQVKQTLSKGGQAVLMTAQSTWLKDRNDFVYIGKAFPDGRLLTIKRYHMEHGQLRRVVIAKSASFYHKQWHLKDITTTYLNDDHTRQTHQASATWAHLVSPNVLQVVLSNGDNLTLWGLHRFVEYRTHNALSTSSYSLKFWRMIIAPWSVLILSLMAVPFVFGPLRSANGGMRMVFGVIFGFVYFIVDQFFGPLTLVYHLAPFLGALLPTLLFGIVLLGMLWRMN